MNFETFCDTVRATFPKATFLLYDKGAYYLAVHSLFAVSYNVECALWSGRCGENDIGARETIVQVRNRLGAHALSVIDNALTLGILPDGITAAIQAHNAAIEQRIAAMTPEERAEREQRLRDAIAARVGTPKETP